MTFYKLLGSFKMEKQTHEGIPPSCRLARRCEEPNRFYEIFGTPETRNDCSKCLSGSHAIRKENVLPTLASCEVSDQTDTTVSLTPDDVIACGSDDESDIQHKEVDYTDLDVVKSVRRPRKSSDIDKFLKEKMATNHRTFETMRQTLANNQPRDFNQNYGIPTPRWKLDNPEEICVNVKKSSPLQATDTKAFRKK